MVIRHSQMKAFEDAAGQRFEDAAWAHVREFAPGQCAAAGEPAARKAISAALAKAGQYGIEQSRPAMQFIDMSFILGAGFDEDPQYPWIGPDLAGPPETAMARMDSLYEAVLKYTVSIAGPEGQFLDAALKRVQQTPVEQAMGVETRLPGATGSWFERVFPEKAAAFGPCRMEELATGWRGDAEACGLVAPAAVFVYSALAFFLGSGFRSDPLVPWAHPAGGPASPDGGEAWARQVYAAGTRMLNGWTSNVPPRM